MTTPIDLDALPSLTSDVRLSIVVASSARNFQVCSNLTVSPGIRGLYYLDGEGPQGAFDVCALGGFRPDDFPMGCDQQKENLARLLRISLTLSLTSLMWSVACALHLRDKAVADVTVSWLGLGSAIVCDAGEYGFDLLATQTGLPLALEREDEEFTPRCALVLRVLTPEATVYASFSTGLQGGWV